MENIEGFEDLDNDTYEVITMTDESGNETEFFVVDAIEIEKRSYLLVVSAQDFDNEKPEACILKEVFTDNNESVYEFIEDDNEYNKALILFQDNKNDYEMEF